MFSLPVERRTLGLVANGILVGRLLPLGKKQSFNNLEHVGNLLLAVERVDCLLLRKIEAAKNQLGGIGSFGKDDLLFTAALQEANGFLKLQVFVLFILGNACSFMGLLFLLIDLVWDFLLERLLLLLSLRIGLFLVAALVLSSRLLFLGNLLERWCGIGDLFLRICHFDFYSAFYPLFI